MIDLESGRRPSSLDAIPLSCPEMQLLVQLLELSELPTVLSVSAGYDHDESRFIALEAARAQLENRGLLSGNAVQQDLEDRLRAVGRPHWVVNIRLFVNGSVSGACLAKGDNGVYAVVLRGPTSYLVAEADADELTNQVLAALPVVRPLEFKGLTAPTEQLGQILDRVGDPAITANELIDLGADPVAATTMGRAVAQTVAHTSMIGVIYGDGTRDIAPRPVAVVDTVEGRIVITATDRDNVAWSSCNSGTPGRVRQALQTLINSLPDRQPFPSM